MLKTPNQFKDLLPIAAWVILAWSWRGLDFPFAVGTILVISWWLLAKYNHRLLPRLPKPVKLTSIWVAVALVVSLLRAVWIGDLPVQTLLDHHLAYLSLLLFIPLAYLLKSQQKHWHYLFLAPIVAVIARIISHSDLNDLENTLFSSSRYGFGRYHIAFGLQSYLSLLSLLIIGPILLRRQKKHQIAVAVILVFAALLVGQSMLASGSRLALVGIVIGIVVLLTTLRSTIRKHIFTRQGLLACLAATTVATTLIAVNWQQIEKRVVKVALSETQYTLNLDELPRDKDIFFARRVHLAAFGLDQWQKKPVFGYSPGAVNSLLKTDPQLAKHTHLHNTYVQAITELGLWGSIPILALGFSLLLGGWQAGHRRSPSQFEDHNSYVRLLYCLSVSMMVWSFGDTMIPHADWKFPVVWIAAMALALKLPEAKEKP